MTPADIQPEDADAFGRGILAGQEAAINGLSLPQPCVNLNAERGIGPHLLWDAPEGIMVIADFVEKVAAGVGGSVIFLINLSIALETFTDNPDERLAQAATALQSKLQEMGFSQSMELFIGGGVDTSQRGCELMLTPIFRSQDAATNSTKALGRNQWFVASWRTDQSGGATTVDSSASF